MDYYWPAGVEERAKCLAAQKIKARIIKDAFIREGYIKHHSVAREVVKYETLYSQKMLDRIKT